MRSDASYAPAIAWTLLSTFLWTLIFAAGKFTGGEIGAFQLTWLRYLGALAVLTLILRWRPY